LFDKTVRLWDAATGTALQTLEDHSGHTIAVTFSPDGRQIASTSYDKTVKLWDAVTGAALQTLDGHSGSIRAVAFSPDGRQLASASYDKTVRLWDAATGAALQTLEIDAVVHALSFSVNALHLETDRGLLDVTTPLLSPGAFLSRSALPHGIFVKKQWVIRGNDNLLWLPFEYRPESEAVRGSVMTLGHASGRISFLEFALS
jgi:WD40 repeat protein